MATETELAALDAATLDFRQARVAQDTSSASGRTPFQRDADRILYCVAFRRLGGVTQVVAVNETQLFHNRLTHSLKVAQIGQRLTQALRARTKVDRLEAAGNIQPDVVYAASLAHDLGHPPFGHVAEDELQRVLAGKGDPMDKILDASAQKDKLDGFEGNAQAFRILTKLAWRSDNSDEPGLNLTRATLAAVLKYPWLKAEAPSDKANKWGAFTCDSEMFEFAVEYPPGVTHGGQWRSPEAAIMDWADDIAYAVHDVEDFYRAGLIPLDRLVNNSGEGLRFISRVSAKLDGKEGMTADEVAAAFERLKSKDLPRAAYDGSRDDQIGLGKLANILITRYTDAVRVKSDGSIETSREAQHEVNVLKQMTWFYMIDNPALHSLQAGQRRKVRGIYRELATWADDVVADQGVADSQLPKQLSEMLRAIRNDPNAVDAYGSDDLLLRRRACVDYVSSLTEPQADELWARITGAASESAIAAWLRN
jgi:dGTPase